MSCRKTTAAPLTCATMPGCHHPYRRLRASGRPVPLGLRGAPLPPLLWSPAVPSSCAHCCLLRFLGTLHHAALLHAACARFKRPAEDVRELAAHTWFPDPFILHSLQIADHTVTHKSFLTQSRSSLEKEILGARAAIAECGIPERWVGCWGCSCTAVWNHGNTNACLALWPCLRPAPACSAACWCCFTDPLRHAPHLGGMCRGPPLRHARQPNVPLACGLFGAAARSRACARPSWRSRARCGRS